MNNPFHIQRELRYGAPVCDEILINRYYTIGYSWYFRQAKWALEIINRNDHLLSQAERLNNFRSDIRIPKRFRAGLNPFHGSGYDRGHLVASANNNILEVQNSETFLMSNMSPQKPNFNRQIWKKLEEATRTLNNDEDIFETYVLTCPVFYFDRMIETIGDEDDDNGIYIPIPHAFVKSVLAEDKRGKLKLWTFKMDNKELDGDLEDYLVVTYDAEQLVGGRFWDKISGGDIHQQKKNPRAMWDY